MRKMKLMPALVLLTLSCVYADVPLFSPIIRRPVKDPSSPEHLQMLEEVKVSLHKPIIIVRIISLENQIATRDQYRYFAELEAKLDSGGHSVQCKATWLHPSKKVQGKIHCPTDPTIKPSSETTPKSVQKTPSTTTPKTPSTTTPKTPLTTTPKKP